MNHNPLLEQSLNFASKIIKLQNYLTSEKKETIISKQIIRSSTSIGANINEANYANSKPDFISKLHISLKEAGESIYWLKLLKNTKLIDYDFDELLSLAEEIKKMLIASINTAKGNNK